MINFRILCSWYIDYPQYLIAYILLFYRKRSRLALSPNNVYTSVLVYMLGIFSLSPTVASTQVAVAGAAIWLK